MITTKYLWEDGIHLQDLGTNSFSNNVIKFVNNSLFSNFDDCFWLHESLQTNDFDSDIDGFINFRKAYQNNPLIEYININSLREKIICLREILSKASIYILCVDKTKLDASFPDHQFKISGYQFPPIRRDLNSKGGGNSFCLWRFHCKTNEKLWDRECWNYMSRTYYCHKEVVYPFCLSTPRHKESCFFNLNKMLGKYDNILLAEI